MSVKNATIGLIAREAGCSPSTVSRVISGYRKGFSVRPELEAKILTLADEFKYKPNPYLRGMRAGKTRIIAIFDTLNCGEGVVQNAKREFIARIQEAGYTESGKYVHLENPESYALTFPADGALFFDLMDGVYLNFVEEKKIPYIVINGMCRSHGVSVLPDEEANVRKLVEYLHRLGHTRIAYFAGHKVPEGPCHHSVIAREMFYMKNLAQLHLIQTSGQWDYRITPEKFLARSFYEEKATVIICYDHTKAIMLLHAAWELGIKVPEEIGIVCFNDAYPLELLTPPITCITTPGESMGSTAARVLLDILDGKSVADGRIIRIEGELVERQSVRKLN